MNILDMLAQLQDGEPKPVAGDDMDFMMPQQQLQKPGMKTEEDMARARQDKIQQYDNRRANPPPSDNIDIPDDQESARQMIARDMYDSRAGMINGENTYNPDALRRFQQYSSKYPGQPALNTMPTMWEDRGHEDFGADPDSYEFKGTKSRRGGKPIPTDKDRRYLNKFDDTETDDRQQDSDVRNDFRDVFGDDQIDPQATRMRKTLKGVPKEGLEGMPFDQLQRLYLFQKKQRGQKLTDEEMHQQLYYDMEDKSSEEGTPREPEPTPAIRPPLGQQNKPPTDEEILQNLFGGKLNPLPYKPPTQYEEWEQGPTPEIDALSRQLRQKRSGQGL